MRSKIYIIDDLFDFGKIDYISVENTYYYKNISLFIMYSYISEQRQIIIESMINYVVIPSEIICYLENIQNDELPLNQNIYF